MATDLDNLRHQLNKLESLVSLIGIYSEGSGKSNPEVELDIVVIQGLLTQALKKVNQLEEKLPMMKPLSFPTVEHNNTVQWNTGMIHEGTLPGPVATYTPTPAAQPTMMHYITDAPAYMVTPDIVGDPHTEPEGEDYGGEN